MPSQPTALDPEQAQDPPSVRQTTAPADGYRVFVAYLLWILGLVGLCGLHRLYLGRWSGLLWLGTFGLGSIGQLVDLFLIP
ncbi:MAG: TM2 domain-containing protein, partial [Synechococcaceae cyanobacterium SM2_3_2]|nr:TM2 domain-containing protein [Synechococcaceae cyanobacterium SM2_3_2]